MEWIEIENRLPEIGEEFLGTDGVYIDHFKRFDVDLFMNLNSCNQSTLEDLFISHWATRPELPVGDKT